MQVQLKDNETKQTIALGTILNLDDRDDSNLVYDLFMHGFDMKLDEVYASFLFEDEMCCYIQVEHQGKEHKMFNVTIPTQLQVGMEYHV